MKNKIINIAIDLIIGLTYITILDIFFELDAFSFAVGCSLIIIWDAMDRLRKWRMKVISIYELLGLIKDGKAPKGVKAYGETFELIENTDTIRDIYVDKDGICKLFDNFWWSLNDEVEILDKEDEFIDIEEITIRDKTIGFPNGEWTARNMDKAFAYKINDLIKNQKKIIEKLEKEGKIKFIWG